MAGRGGLGASLGSVAEWRGWPGFQNGHWPQVAFKSHWHKGLSLPRASLPIAKPQATHQVWGRAREQACCFLLTGQPCPPRQPETLWGAVPTETMISERLAACPGCAEARAFGLLFTPILMFCHLPSPLGPVTGSKPGGCRVEDPVCDPPSSSLHLLSFFNFAGRKGLVSHFLFLFYFIF